MKNLDPSIFVLIFLFFASSLNCRGDSNDKLFYDAVRAEAAGDLENAIEIYLDISQDAHSANLHANLANLYFKTQDYARAILHFRRALWIDPQKRDYHANLSLALVENGVPKDDLHYLESSYSPNFQKYWLVGLSVWFWIGLLFSAFFFRFPMKNKTPVSIFLLWAIGMFLLGHGFIKSCHFSDLLNREVIAVNSLSGSENSEMGLDLRVFAGKGSSANTKVPLGSSLFVDQDENGLPRIHHSPSGEKWFLVRDGSGTDKGWIHENEFAPVLDINW